MSKTACPSASDKIPRRARWGSARRRAHLARAALVAFLRGSCADVTAPLHQRCVRSLLMQTICPHAISCEAKAAPEKNDTRTATRCARNAQARTQMRSQTRGVQVQACDSEPPTCEGAGRCAPHRHRLARSSPIPPTRSTSQRGQPMTPPCTRICRLSGPQLLHEPGRRQMKNTDVAGLFHLRIRGRVRMRPPKPQRTRYTNQASAAATRTYPGAAATAAA